jgi:hypothetical protein
VFIVQAKPREAEGIVKVIKNNRRDALQAAKDFPRSRLAVRLHHRELSPIFGDGRAGQAAAVAG